MIEQYPLTVWASYVQKGGNLFEKEILYFMEPLAFAR